MLSLLLHCWRSWARAKSIAVLAIFALAIGIGCATSVFTVVNAVMLNPLPYKNSSRWVALFGGSTLEPTRYSALTIRDLNGYQQRTHSFDVFGWYKISSDFNLNSSGVTEHIAGAEVTPSLLEGVGVHPLSGRLFREADGPQVALISSRLWRQLGSHPNIEGKPIALDGKSYTIVGVLPGWFQLPIVSVDNENLQNDVWIPVDQKYASEHGNSGMYAVYARMKPGMTVPAARADVKTVANAIAKESQRPATYTATLFGLQDFVVKKVRPFLFLLMGAAGVLLLITCANAGGLLVARSVQRSQEIAVRVALGAQKRQLIVQFVTEGLFISLSAAALGVLASIGLTRLFLQLAAAYIPRAENVSISPMVLVFAAGLVFVTALLPALAPLRQAARTQPTEVLTSSVRASAGLRSRRLSNWLVIAEIAFAFLLLSSGGLLVAKLYALRHTSPGFDASHLLTFQIDAPEGQFSSSAELLQYQRAVLTAMQSIPGIQSAAIANQLPLHCCLTTSIYPEGDSSNEGRDVSFVVASAGYFKTLGLALEKGRLLNEHDGGDLPGVAINAAAADAYWHGRDPVGGFGHVGSATGDRFQVVGVVGNMRNEGLGQNARPEIYLLDAEAPVRQMKFIVRSPLPPTVLLPLLRHSVETTGPSLPVYAVNTMDQLAGESTSLERFASVVVTFFAVSALALACLGIYSMTAFSLAERKVEFGTRMALGATPRDLMRLIMGDSIRLAMYGVIAGVPAAAAMTWIIGHYMQLHHQGALPYAGSAVVVSCLATAACLPPAWRATFLSPLAAIRQEPEDFWTTGRRSIEVIASALKPGPRVEATSPNVFAGLVEATRRADSTTQLLAEVLQTVRTQFGSEWTMICERAGGPDASFACLAADPQDRVCKAFPDDGYLIGRLRSQTLLTFEKDEFDTVLRWAAEQHNPHVAEVEQLNALGVRVAVALWARSEITGLLLFGSPQERQHYGDTDKELMKTTAQQLALMIENARLTDRLVEQEKVRRDVALAAEVQKRFLPQSSMNNEQSTAAASFQPARVVSGDCYDFLHMGDESLGFALADVAGKGVAAALVTAAVQSAIRIIAAQQTVTPTEIVRQLNAFLYRNTGSSTYATFFFANLRGRQFRYVNAGHNPPWLFRRFPVNGQAEPSYTRVGELNVGGTFVGMFPEPAFEEGLVALEPGDFVFAFTDGVPEALNTEDEEFGEERLHALACQYGSLPVDEMVARIREEVREWIGAAPQHDDLTLVVIKTV